MNEKIHENLKFITLKNLIFIYICIVFLKDFHNDNNMIDNL